MCADQHVVQLVNMLRNKLLRGGDHLYRSALRIVNTVAMPSLNPYLTLPYLAGSRVRQQGGVCIPYYIVCLWESNPTNPVTVISAPTHLPTERCYHVTFPPTWS